MPSAGSSRAEALPAEFAGHRADLGCQPRDAPLVTLQDAGDLLAEGLHPAAQDRAAHPPGPHLHDNAPPVDGNVGRRPLVIAVHAGRLRAAPGHDTAPARVLARTHDHVARVLDILDDQRRQPRKHSPHKLRHINHD